jgi:hypothetical protein
VREDVMEKAGDMSTASAMRTKHTYDWRALLDVLDAALSGRCVACAVPNKLTRPRRDAVLCSK